jgi:glycosyltransferase involved in cell wall biosynthesis
MKISIVCVNLNHEKYIWKCLNSVVSQSYENWELLIADGGSSDNSLAIIESFNDSRIKILQGNDSSCIEGMMKGISAASGDAIMMTTSTDGYVDTDWFKTCASNLAENQLISLVWGGWTQLRENLLSFSVGPHQSRHDESHLQLFQNWISSVNIERAYLPELNYCVRASVYKKCVQICDQYPLLGANFDPPIRFHFNFMREGYIAKFIPTIASFGREHEDQLQNQAPQGDYLSRYSASLAQYREGLLSGKFVHSFKDPQGKIFTELRLNKS